MRRVALTGGIATGKSHVRAQFETLGVPTIDADVLARQAVAPGSPGLDAVIARFGREVLDAQGNLNRRTLSELVFADEQARRDLEAIVHPAVRGAIDRWLASLDPARHAIAIADIPLLFETGREHEFDIVIVTACDPESQVKRVVARDGIGETEARLRVAAQLPIAEKVRRADYVIHTDGTVEQTNVSVRELYEHLTQPPMPVTER